MSSSEKSERQASLYKAVTTHTSHSWAATLLRMLLTQMGNELTAHQTPLLDKARLKSYYTKAQKRLFLFDYDVSAISSFVRGCDILAGNLDSDSENTQHGRPV